ncbi:serine carboxypeptidase-like [Vitis riparia]|uniref:serine carboxypeptidase-like n=1 Tax=Vitis riparia TaxID=96939 RepID=UPI00155A9992|nr:serine carboxypeptidase-like [Vitis riparia]
MASTFSLLFLSLCLLLSSQFSSARVQNSYLHVSPTLNTPKTEAERLIRSLNLSPKKAVNMGFDHGEAAPRMVEKSLNFPFLEGSSGSSVQDLGHRAGYFKLAHTVDARMFYFFFESRGSKKDPVVIWLTGGPGCSSQLALFYENGPFHITDNLTLSWNDYGWDQASNILFVDQPTGTGFSYSSSESDIRHTEEGVSNDLYDFMQAFFKKHPEFVRNDFFITGESYAGHYIPAFAARVQKGNKAKEGVHINLKGFAIGNGLTDPAIQYKAYTDYALNMKIIGKSDYDSINELIPDCEESAKSCGPAGGVACDTAYYSCNQIFQSIINVAGNINYYDIRKQCEGSLCYDFSNLENFMGLQSVKEAIGVGDMEFVSCSSEVYNAMQRDWMRDMEVGIPALLEDGIKMLIYAGEYDLICNWLGNSNWVHAMKWSGQKDFEASPTVPYLVDGKEAGQLKYHGRLAFLKVHNAGHMVPMDQPKAALQMLKTWTQGKLAPKIKDETTW